MKATAMTDTSDLRARLNLYAQVVGKEVSQSLREHARVACVELANVTQPYGRTQADKKVGEQSILNDVSKVFYTANEPTRGYENSLKQKVDQSRRSDKAKESFKKRIERICRSGDSGQIAWLASFFKTERVQLDTLDKSLYYNARTGRRTNIPKRTKMLALVIGAEGELKKFKEERMKTSGTGKAGWAVCAEKINLDQAQAATRGIPQWVTRCKKFSAPANSTVVDQSNDPVNPKMILNNAVPWVSNLLSDSQAKVALEIARNKFVKHMNIAIKKTLRDQVKLKAA
jgi:hypothetical protein